jgi:hypothetical protein
MKHLLDPEALFVALVLCPGVYSRNRFYAMYSDPAMLAVRRRAAQIRSVVAELCHSDLQRRGKIISFEQAVIPERKNLTYVVASLGLRRTVSLSPFEWTLIRYVAERRFGTLDGFDSLGGACEEIELVLRGLSPDIADSARKALENDLFDDETDENVFQDVPREVHQEE